jgi:pimeloyl-ACP methyl ester carboxylesterase
MAQAQVGDVTLEYVIDGPDDGEPMLLIMGLGAQLVAWPPDFVELLAGNGFTVIRFDNRDMGLSGKVSQRVPSVREVAGSLAHRKLVRSDYLLHHMAADAAGLLDVLGIESAHVVGVSMGGMIAQELVLNYPERVRSLVSIMSNTGDKRHGVISPALLPGMMRQQRSPLPTTREAAIQRGVDTYRMIGGSHFNEDEVRTMMSQHVDRDSAFEGRDRQLLAINASPDRTKRLGSVRVPTLVVHGLADKLVMPSGGIATAKAIPGSRLLMFPDMAHDLPKPRRAEIVEAIVANARRAS